MVPALTATFNPLYKAKAASTNTHYSSLQSACDMETSGATILAQDYFYLGALGADNRQVLGGHGRKHHRRIRRRLSFVCLPHQFNGGTGSFEGLKRQTYCQQARRA
jgi:hypothetical protein